MKSSLFLHFSTDFPLLIPSSGVHVGLTILTPPTLASASVFSSPEWDVSITITGMMQLIQGELSILCYKLP